MKPLNSKTFTRYWMELYRDTYEPGTVSQDFSLGKIYTTVQTLRSHIFKIGYKYGWHRFPRFADNHYLQTLIQQPLAQFHSLVHKGRIIGAAIIIPTSDSTEGLEIQIFGLYDEYTNQGYGKKFAKLLLNRLFQDTDRVMLITRDSNIDGVFSFYKELGFQIYKEKIIENDLLIDPVASKKYG